MKRQILVIGGGASGLAAAISAADSGASVQILERLPRVGKKILLTGNGRCNLSHTPLDFSHYHGTVPQMKRILVNFHADAYFREMGLLTRTDGEGRQYPYSMAAASVLDALRLTAEQKGVQMTCDAQVTGITPTKNGFTVHTKQDDFHADALICAAGGAASPACGTDGSLYPVLKKLGHKIVKPLPALCPVPVSSPYLKQMKGLRVRACVTAERNGKALASESGEVQFTETALSGICVFNLSRLAAIHGNALTLCLNLMPETDADTLFSLIGSLISQRGSLPVSDLLTGLLPKRIGEVLVKLCGGSPAQTARAVFSQKERISALCRLLHRWEFPVSGVSAFSQAQVTAGGVSGQSVTANLESKVCPGLYFCGEILDTDGDCGGYNLAWAWASGQFVGKCCANAE